MIDIPTLFILGSGASKPYGYPTGKELRTEIISKFLPEFGDLLNKSKKTSYEKKNIRENSEEFLKHFSKSPLYSIDKFLSLNPDFSDIGKIAITLRILDHEKTSKFHTDMDSPYDKEDWYSLIFNHMTTLKLPESYKKFRENKIAFITFNYDRSLEYFLYDGFYHTFWQNMHGFGAEIKEYIPFPVVHVYGQVDELSLSRWPENSNYREDFNWLEKIEQLSEGIRVIGDRLLENMKSKIKELIEKSKRIFFLGFGYAEENLEVIGIPKNIDENHDVFGTAKGMQQKEIRDIIKMFPIRQSERISQPGDKIETIKDCAKIENKNSYELLREYL